MASSISWFQSNFVDPRMYQALAQIVQVPHVSFFVFFVGPEFADFIDEQKWCIYGFSNFLPSNVVC